MYDNLIAHINTQLAAPMTAEEIAVLKDAFKPKKLRKHQFLLQEGEVCRIAGFITKGALKQYSIDETGKESILALCIENWWAGDRESFTHGTPSAYFIDAFEDTELLVVTKDVFLEKLSNQRFMTEFMRSLTERNAFQLLKRVHATKTLTAEQRLADLESTYPAFFQRFPQHIIASYLGMTKETMSRIRSKPIKK
jgi:CRP-like cAMP-binding protein